MYVIVYITYINFINISCIIYCYYLQIPFTGVSVRWFGEASNPLRVHSLTWDPNAVNYFSNSINNKYDTFGISIEGCRTAGPIVDSIVTGAILDYELHRDHDDELTALHNMDIYINSNGKVLILPVPDSTLDKEL